MSRMSRIQNLATKISGAKTAESLTTREVVKELMTQLTTPKIKALADAMEDFLVDQLTDDPALLEKVREEYGI